jgi:hypothetical protein
MAEWHQPVTLASDRVVNSLCLAQTIQSHMENNFRGLPPSDLLSTIYHSLTQRVEDMIVDDYTVTYGKSFQRSTPVKSTIYYLSQSYITCRGHDCRQACP